MTADVPDPAVRVVDDEQASCYSVSETPRMSFKNKNRPRREYLGILGASTITALAGCSSEDDDNNSGELLDDIRARSAAGGGD